MRITTRAGDLARLLRVHPETIRRAAARGELRSVRVGKASSKSERRYPESAVRAWLAAVEERSA